MVLVDADVKNDAMRDFLYRDRTQLAVYAKAMFGLALRQAGRQGKAGDDHAEHRASSSSQDDENQTAYLNLPENNYWWYWYGSEYEANAYYLKLLAATEPKSEVAPRLVKYLLNNRKHATYWNSTRDTALVRRGVRRLPQGQRRRQARPDRRSLDRRQEAEGGRRSTPTTCSRSTTSSCSKATTSTTGEHTIELQKHGTGPLYFNAYLTNFTLEDHITKAGLEVKVEPQVLQAHAGRQERSRSPASAARPSTRRSKSTSARSSPNLATRSRAATWSKIELEIDSKNDYEYILFEDMKAAGFEPVDVRSGYNGNDLGAYMELRDNRVSFFVRTLARGKHSVATACAPKSPASSAPCRPKPPPCTPRSCKANSDEIKLKIED